MLRPQTLREIRTHVLLLQLRIHNRTMRGRAVTQKQRQEGSQGFRARRNAEETGMYDRFPADVVQSPEAVAEACLAGLELGESVCFPRLEDYSKWEAARDAIRAVGRDPTGNKVASRYGVSQHS